MTNNISFDPYLSWVDTTDPDNLPQDAKLITAADLLRYENFGVAATTAVNGLIGDIAQTNSDVEANTTAIAAQAADIDGLTTQVENLNATPPAAEWWIVKPSHQVRTNTTVFGIDTALNLSLAAGKIYAFEVVLFVQTPVDGDIKLYISAGNGAYGVWGVASGLDSTATGGAGIVRPAAFTSWDGSNPIYLGGTSYNSMMILKGTVHAPNATTLALYWTQATASATNTMVIADSTMHVRVVGTE